MTNHEQNKINISASIRVYIRVAPLLLFVFYFLFFNKGVFAAEEGLSLTVTPPLFQLNIGPGELWTSSLKIVNSNPYDLTVYASLMDFEAQGEEGHGKFIPVMNAQTRADGTQNNVENFAQNDAENSAREASATSSHSLASWIEISKEPIFVPKGQSSDIVFTVRIPENAEPGGHYAAILVGTKPIGREADEGAMVSVSSMITSLLFVNVRGDVLESGNIREFKSEKNFYQKPDVNFVLRFENKGNVHLQPQGNIIIYNMWGKERGKIFINKESNFGNVLPSSIRKFSFEWLGKENIFEAGKYKAVATLSFGLNGGKQSAFSETYFWVAPVVPILGIVFGLGLLIFLLIWTMKAYIRKALRLEAKRKGFGLAGFESLPLSPQDSSLSLRAEGEAIPEIAALPLDKLGVARNDDNKDIDVLNLKILARPIYQEALDLKKAAERLRGTTRIDTRIDAETSRGHSSGNFPRNVFKLAVYMLARYWKVLVFLAAVVAIIIFLTAYFGQTFIPSREFEIKIKGAGNNILP